jgi:hypothetical protein
MRFSQQNTRMVGNLPGKVVDKMNNKVVVTQNLADLIAVKCPKKSGTLRVKFQNVACKTECAVKRHVINSTLIRNVETCGRKKIVIRKRDETTKRNINIFI